MLDELGLPCERWAPTTRQLRLSGGASARRAPWRAKRCELGIVICGTGIGIDLAANKVQGIRRAMASEPYSAMMARQHNNANMIAIGARVLGQETAKMIVRAFLTSSFEGGRHQRRVGQIIDIERREHEQ